MDYEKLLKKARKTMPKKALSDNRLEVPEPIILVIGNKTIFKNYQDILKVINRDEALFIKFIAKETASPVTKEKTSCVINRKIYPFAFKQIINKFITRFARCPVCKKLDTHFENINNIKMLKCQACGAYSPVKGI